MFLGAVQGLTEFLPVSSSGHLAIAQHYLPGFSQPGVMFDVMLHVGTLVAVVLYFKKEIGALLWAPFSSTPESAPYRRLLVLLIAGSVPTAIIGLTFKDFFEGLFQNLTVVSLMLLVTGVLLFISERFRRQGRRESEMTLSDALVVGTVQGFAIVPGISRSGSTIATLLLKGVDGETAARFSFLLSLPAICGAALLSLGDLEHISSQQFSFYLAGAGVAFVTGMLSIHFLMGVIRNRRLFAFALYCWIAGGTLFAFSF